MGSFWQRSATVGVVVLIICSVVVGFGVVVVFASVVVLSRAVGPAVVEFAVAGDVVDFSDLAPSPTTDILLTLKVHPSPKLPRVPTKMATMEAGVKPDAVGTTTTVNSTITDPWLQGKDGKRNVSSE